MLMSMTTIPKLGKPIWWAGTQPIGIFTTQKTRILIMTI